MVLPIEVKENTQPKFEFDPQSIFELQLNETLVYEMPKVTDTEANAESVTMIEAIEGYEDLYPPFMTVINRNQTLLFEPTESIHDN